MTAVRRVEFNPEKKYFLEIRNSSYSKEKYVHFSCRSTGWINHDRSTIIEVTTGEVCAEGGIYEFVCGKKIFFPLTNEIIPF